MKRRRPLIISIIFLAAVHAAVLLAGFLAPYSPVEQNREHPFAPRTRIHFLDEEGNFHWRPFVYLRAPGAIPGEAAENTSRSFPLRFFVVGDEYKILGLFSASTHLIGVEAPARIFLLGTDSLGRDEYSRLLYGGRISLLAGLVAAMLSLGLGWLIGTFAGFYGGWLDEALMRGAELILALPWIYLLFAVRAFLPLDAAPEKSFFLVICVIGLVGWARPARLVRGIVLSGKERYYVTAARGFGAPDSYILRRHVLPQTWGVVLTQAALLIPQFILAEVTLSFLGLGVSEPAPSWGGMLAAAQQYHVLVSYWWLLSPGIALVPVFLAYSALASALHERWKSVAV